MSSNSLNLSITNCLKNLTEDTVTATCSLFPSITHFLSFLKRRGSSVVGKTLTSPLIPWVDVKREQVAVTVSSVKFFKQFVILKFKEFDDINDIEKYTKCDLLVSREDAVKLEPGEYFICDLIGLDVITDEGKHLGVLKDVLETGANNVYEVEADNGESYLIPVDRKSVRL